VAGSNSYGFQCANAANENAFYSCRCIGTSSSTGFVVNAHAIKLFDPDAEAGLDTFTITYYRTISHLQGTTAAIAARVRSERPAEAHTPVLMNREVVSTVMHWTQVLRVDPDNRFVHGLLVRICK
jgi:hypothetical protein